MVVARDWGEKGVTVKWVQSFSWKDEKVLEMVAGDGCRTM